MFTINLQLNLTNLLEVRLDARSFNGTYIINSSRDENITIRTDIYYINGSGPITDLLGLSNFTSIWLQERNVTDSNGRIPASGSLDKFNATTGAQAPYCAANCLSWGNLPSYYINATVMSGKPGGLYDFYVNVSYTRNSLDYSGVGSNGTLTIDNTGLYMNTSNSTSISLTTTTTSYLFCVNMSNFGTNAASSSYIKFVKPASCSGYSIAYTSISGEWCGASVNDDTTNVSLTIPAYNNSCLICWMITNATASTTSACTSYFSGSPSTKWFNPRGINVSVSITGPTTTTTTATTLASSASQATTTTTTIATTTTTTTIPPTEEVVTVTSIKANESASFSISNSDVLKVQNITIKVKNNVTNVKVTVKESSLPSNASLVIATDKGTVYKYLEITKANITDDDIENVKIKFKVDKEWTNNNTIDTSTIALYRYANGNWTKLTTRLLSSDNDYHYFEAESSSLSIFAIAGEKFLMFLGIPLTWQTWVLIAVGICAVAFLLYLFWPTKEYKPEVSELLKPKEGIFKKIRNAFSRIKEGISKRFRKTQEKGKLMT